MYPRLSDVFIDLFGFELPFPIYSFGAMMAIAFLVAAWLLGKELDRLHEIGRLRSVRIAVPQGKSKKRKMQNASPSTLVGTVTIIAVVGGIGGAKLFHILENFGDFTRDPFGMIFSAGGLTFLGGLITAALAIAWYVRKHKLSIPTFADATAPVLILAYGIGRIGCQLAGDGDWGIASSLANKPGWIPAGLWAETYPNNILNMTLPGDGVFPTPIYETAMCLILFAILWSVRKHPFMGGWLFSLYLVFVGIERLLIEQIRVNNTFELFGMTVTQAEIISVVLIILGIIGLIKTSRRRDAEASSGTSAVAAAPA